MERVWSLGEWGWLVHLEVRDRVEGWRVEGVERVLELGKWGSVVHLEVIKV